MNLLFKNIARIGRFFINLLPLSYKVNHKFQNKYQITNTLIILNSLKNKGFFPDFIVDVGCGYGEWFLKANKIFKNSKFYLFDADKNNKNKLNKLKIKFKNMNYKICLLSNEHKQQKFYRMGYGSSVYEEKSSYPREIDSLTSTTLKDELDFNLIKNSKNIIKLDVQGAELDILRGLHNNLSFFEIVILEVSIREHNMGSPLFPEVFNFMRENNYTIYDLCDLKRLGNEKSILVQFDCIFVRKNSFLLNQKLR
tara:strand:+ start:606 stop:1364 length:759 start_codon:yes stop_codon:yes gene_type:complete